MSDKKLEIIVPWRDRLDDLNEFVPNISKFLEHHGIKKYRITIVNQLLHAQFNRGKLLNVGFLESCEDSDYSIFHDVDVYPVIYEGRVSTYELLTYDGVEIEYHGTPDYHYHKGAWSLYKGCQRSCGGIFKISNDLYEKVNGTTNSLWGWGYEDNDLYYRICEEGVRIYEQGKRKSKYGAAHFHERSPTGFKGAPEHVVNEAIGAKMWADKDHSFKYDGLSSCNYRVDSVGDYGTYRILNVYL